jgi:hypothetical protein
MEIILQFGVLSYSNGEIILQTSFFSKSIRIPIDSFDKIDLDRCIKSIGLECNIEFTKGKKPKSTKICFKDRQQADFTEHYIKRLTTKRTEYNFTKTIDPGFFNGMIVIEEDIIIYSSKKQVYYFFKDEIEGIEIVDDNNTSIKDIIFASMIAGGLGALASKINPNTKYNLIIKTNRYSSINIKFQKYPSLIEFLTDIDLNIINKITSSIDENPLKVKLNELELLKEEGVITLEEFQYKRKQIIDKY